MRAARIIKTKEPLRIDDLRTPKPKNEQVLVRVESAGVCHSDLHLWEGGYAGPQGVFMKVEDRGVKFPLTPGHEVAGRIEEIGESVTGFQTGERVLVYPWIGEGLCPACRVGEENLCDLPRTLGIYQDGGYSELILVPSHRYLVKIQNLDINASASLACSGLTAYTAVKKANAQASETVVLVDVDDKKLSEAKRLGADQTINSLSTDAVKGIKDITGGIGSEIVIDFVNNAKTAQTTINMIRKRGRLIMVGLFGGALELNLPLIPLRAFTLTGAYTGKFADLVDLVAMAKSGKIQSVVSRKYKLDKVNQALDELKGGKIIGRGVLNP